MSMGNCRKSRNGGARAHQWKMIVCSLAGAFLSSALPAYGVLARPVKIAPIGGVTKAPSGWVLRALSPWATGWEQPPDWPTTQDPWGAGLVLALVVKEVPFLLWTAASQLQRADAGARWAQEREVARTMG